jgi:dihydrodipicolinate reductase
MAAAAAAGSVRVAILGTGRMAQAVVDAAHAQADVAVAALVGPQAPAWDSELAWYAHLDELPDTVDLLIDFSLPQGTETAAAWCREPRAAAVLDAATPVLIEDIHHQWKKDAPSGTALMLGSVVSAGRGGDGRAIEYQSRREGEVIGEHTVTFRLAGEEIGLVHRAGDRSIYALGALHAGRWLKAQPAGLYSASDWLAGR